MEKSTQIKTKMAQVQVILTKMPETRDNDRELITTYWRIEQPMLFAFRNAEAVLLALVNKQLASPDDITRARRKVQQLCPELRGSTWRERQRYNAEEEVRTNINKPEPDITGDGKGVNFNNGKSFEP